MADNKATPVIVAGVLGLGVTLLVTGLVLSRRSRAPAEGPLTFEILAPPEGTSSPSGARIDFSARAIAGARDISALTEWFIVQPAPLASFWSTGATTFIIPSFLTTQILEMEARIKDLATGQSASARRSVLITVVASQGLRALGPARGTPVSRVVPSFRRSDTGWQVRDRHIIEEPWELARR